MSTHRAIPNTKFCQDCELWLPAIDVVEGWRDCSRDHFRCAETVRAATAADPTVEARIRATDSDAPPQPADYVRWNTEFIHFPKKEAV